MHRFNTMSSTMTAPTAPAMPIPIPNAVSLTTPSPSTSPVPFSSSSSSPPLLLSRTVLEWPAPDPIAGPRSVGTALLQLSLAAPGPHAAVFKFKTNAPNLYRVKPSAGTVAPGASLVVLVQCADLSHVRVHADNLLLQMCFDLSPPESPAVTSQAGAAQLIRSLDRAQIVEQVLSCTIRRPSSTLLGSSHPPTPRATSPVAGATFPLANRAPSPVLSTVDLRRSSFSSVHEHPLETHDLRSLSPSPSRIPSPPPTGPTYPGAPLLSPTSTSPPLRSKPRQRRTSTMTASPILRTTLLSNASSPPAPTPRSLSPGAWPATTAPRGSGSSLSAKPVAAHLSVAPVLAPGQLRATPLAWVLGMLQHVLNQVLGNLLTMTLGTFILAGIALTRGSTWLVGVLLAPVCRVAGRVQGRWKLAKSTTSSGVVARAMNGSNRGGKVARMFPFGVFRRWRRDSAAAVSIDVAAVPPEVLVADGPGVVEARERFVEQAVAL